MKLVDTSSWVQALRANGRKEVRERVADLLRRGEACWCAPVRLELWAGVGKGPEAAVLHRYAEVLPDVPVGPEVWRWAETLAGRGRKRGLSAPAMDILIAACARHHGLELENDDADFDWLMTV
ncbi:MAG: PIN domain-containing protein [Puniceicoccaceae bacterium]|nr:MAG: PIN domain-containing protein [Puniceicoccaceae bacterium]